MQGTLEAIPWPDDTFDLVYSHEVLEHIPPESIPACLSELVRVSRGTLGKASSLCSS